MSAPAGKTAWLWIDDDEGRPDNATLGVLVLLGSHACAVDMDGWLPAAVVGQEATAAELATLTAPRADGRAPLLHRPGDECSCLERRQWPAERGGYWVHEFYPDSTVDKQV